MVNEYHVLLHEITMLLICLHPLPVPPLLIEQDENGPVG